jgi:hypothetical protein
MGLTEREKMVLAEIREWESELLNYVPNDFELTYEKYLERAFSLLPERAQQEFFAKLDNWMFHLNALIQGSQLHMDARDRILTAARIFKSDIQTVEDLTYLTIDQLKYIAQQQIARHRIYSFVQGGLAGSGSSIMLGADIPAMTVINLRIVQLIAAAYGVEVNTPYEMMSSLKVFHAATLPPRLQGAYWEELKREAKSQDDYYFYEGSEEVADVSWLELPIKHLFKGLAIYMFRNKSLQGMPLISMAIGAGTNYQLTRKVTDFAQKYYQMRYFYAKRGES